MSLSRLQVPDSPLGSPNSRLGGCSHCPEGVLPGACPPHLPVCLARSHAHNTPKGSIPALCSP